MSQIQKTPEMAAATIADRILSQTQGLAAQLKQVIANGVPANAQQGYPAVSAKQIVDALGVENLAVLNSVIAAVN